MLIVLLQSLLIIRQFALGRFAGNFLTEHGVITVSKAITPSRQTTILFGSNMSDTATYDVR